VPSAPALNPVNGGTVTVSEGQQVTVSWSAPALADSYERELYPAGTNCLTSGAYCDPTTGLSYTFLPLYPSYYYRVRALNSTCSTQWGDWAAATFSVRGTISGQVKQDDSDLAVLVGGVCSLAGASGIQPGSGAQVTVNASYFGSVDGTGSYSVKAPVGAGILAVLTPASAIYHCTCPAGCVYSTSVPKTSLVFFVSDIRPAWWQAVGGNIHADGGNVHSNSSAFYPRSAFWMVRRIQSFRLTRSTPARSAARRCSSGSRRRLKRPEKGFCASAWTGKAHCRDVGGGKEQKSNLREAGCSFH